MKINEYKLNYIDKEAFELVDLLSVSEVAPKPAPKKETGSLSEQKPILILNNVTSLVGKQGSQISETTGNKSIGFDEKSGKRFQKFIFTIHDDPNVNAIISRTFIESKAWQWLLKTKQNSKAESNFSSYILSEMENATTVNKFHFPIVCMNIEVPFKIGSAEFGYFTSDYFNKFIDGFAKHQPDKENSYIGIRNEYRGMVYVATTVSGEPKRAEEVALEICSLSMDILKICSNVLDFPHAPMDFDIDSRSQFNPQSEVIVESTDVLKGLTLNMHRQAYPYLLDKAQLEHIKNRRLEIFNDFILGLSSHQTELEKLIIQGIKQFASSLTNTNYFKRVAELYTVLESLLLLNEDLAINDTVCKYVSKLITKDIDRRKAVIKLLKEMYKVRSNWVHHAKEKEFQLGDLAELQKIVHELLISLIGKTKSRRTKQELRDEIDDAIIGAY